MVAVAIAFGVPLVWPGALRDYALRCLSVSRMPGRRAAEVFYRSAHCLFFACSGAMGVGMAAFCLWIVVRQGR